MSHQLQLSAGALLKICQGQDVTDPVLQVLGYKPDPDPVLQILRYVPVPEKYGVPGRFYNFLFSPRYRVLLNDGQFSSSFVLLATSLNILIYHKQFAPFTIIKIKKHQVGADKVVEILEVEVLIPGDQVGVKLGNPAEIGWDGKVPVGARLTALR